MSVDLKNEQALKLLHELSLGLVREGRPEGVPDFTLRQLAILLTVYLESPPHTVRGLAKKLGVTKPVVLDAELVGVGPGAGGKFIMGVMGTMRFKDWGGTNMGAKSPGY